AGVSSVSWAGGGGLGGWGMGRGPARPRAAQGVVGAGGRGGWGVLWMFGSSVGWCVWWLWLGGGLLFGWVGGGGYGL
ncbi:hypothetical protein RA268_27855, partial [Pseudomonas syringae pv. tagetis]